jgi:hypothetical protein
MSKGYLLDLRHSFDKFRNDDVEASRIESQETVLGLVLLNIGGESEADVDDRAPVSRIFSWAELLMNSFINESAPHPSSGSFGFFLSIAVHSLNNTLSS